MKKAQKALLIFVDTTIIIGLAALTALAIIDLLNNITEHNRTKAMFNAYDLQQQVRKETHDHAVIDERTAVELKQLKAIQSELDRVNQLKSHQNDDRFRN